MAAVTQTISWSPDMILSQPERIEITDLEIFENKSSLEIF